MSVNERDLGWISREAREPIGDGRFEAPFSDEYGFVGITAAGQDALSQAERMLAGIPKGVDKAVRSAISRAATHLRTVSTKTIRETYAVSQKTIRDNENIQVDYRCKNGVQVYVHFNGQLIPLHRFDGAAPKQPTKDTSAGRVPVMHGLLPNEEGRWHLMYPGVPARGHVLKSTSPTVFSHAFVARVNASKGAAHTGIFERTGGMTNNSKDEIEELFGPAVPQMLDNQEVREKLVKESMETFEKRLLENVNAILYGYMKV